MARKEDDSTIKKQRSIRVSNEWGMDLDDWQGIPFEKGFDVARTKCKGVISGFGVQRMGIWKNVGMEG